MMTTPRLGEHQATAVNACRRWREERLALPVSIDVRS